MTVAPFVRQTSSADTQEKRWAWVIETAEEGAREGYAYFAVEFDQKTLTVSLQGWRTRQEADSSGEGYWGADQEPGEGL